MNDPHDDVLDQQLRAAFAPPGSDQLAAMARAAIAPVRRPLWPWLLAAAALLLTIALAFTRPVRGPEGHDGAQLGAMWAAAFQDAETNGFASGACCDGGQDFGVQCERRFAARLQFAGGGDLTVHGCYCGLSTGGCLAALAEAGDERVAVFVLPRDRDPRPCLPAGCALHLVRRELGPVVLYAVSRAPQHATLEQFALGS